MPEEKDINFRSTTDLIAYFEADHIMRANICAATHMGRVGQVELQAFFIMQSVAYQTFIDELLKRNGNIKIEEARVMPQASKLVR